jgi:hypothetical protein
MNKIVRSHDLSEVEHAGISAAFTLLQKYQAILLVSFGFCPR